MKIAIRIVVGLVVLVVAVLSAGVVVLMTVDPNDYRDQLTTEVKSVTGRELVIKGDLKLGISLIPTIVANDVSFANAPWGSRPQMATLKRLETSLQILPLLSGEVRVGHIVLVEPNILLEVANDGRANWDFSNGGAGTPPRGKTESSAEGTPPIIPVIEAVSIAKATLRYLDRRSKQDLTLTLDRARIDDVGSSERVKIDIAGAYNGAGFQLKGSADPVQKLVADANDYFVDIEANALAVTARVKGSVARAMSAPQLALDLSVSGKDLTETLKAAKAFVPDLDAAKVPAIGGFEVSGRANGPASAPAVENLKFNVGTTDALRIEGTGKGRDGTYTLDRFQAKLKGSDIGGTLTAATKGKVPNITADLTAKRFDVADALALVPGNDSPAGGSAAGDAAKGKAAGGGDGRVFPADPLPLDGLTAVNADVSLKAGELVVHGNRLDYVDVKAVLKDGRLTVDPLAAVIAEGRLAGRAVLDSAQRTPTLDTNVTMTKINVGKLAKEQGLTDQLTGAASAKLNAKGSGSSVRAIMAGLNGNTEITLEDGRFDTAFDRGLSVDVLSIVTGLGSTILSGLTGQAGKAGQTKINCFVSRFDIKQGIATSTGLLFDTEKMSVLGEGKIDLRTEQLDLKLKPEAKGGISLNLAPAVDVTGTLANPSVAPAKLSLLRGVAGIALMGLNPVGLVASVAGANLGDQNPCVAALDQKREQKPGGQSSGQSPPPQQQPSNNPVDNITRGVQDTLKSIFGGGK